MEVFTERLRREHGTDAIVTAPSVVYEYEEVSQGGGGGGGKGVEEEEEEGKKKKKKKKRIPIAAPSDFPTELMQRRQRGSGGKLRLSSHLISSLLFSSLLFFLPPSCRPQCMQCNAIHHP